MLESQRTRSLLASAVLAATMANAPIHAQSVSTEGGTAPERGATDTTVDAFGPATITYLYGFGWDPHGGRRDVATVEYVNQWTYGDNYFVFEAYELLAVRDGTAPTPSIYGEWHPRLSLTNLTGGRLAAGPLNNLSLAGELNIADNFTAVLYGVGFDWSFPGAPWLTTNLYLRDDHGQPGATWHVLVYAGADFEAGTQRIKFFGFVDAFGPEGGRDDMVYAEWQVFLDVGRWLFRGGDALFAGVELHASRNAFGNGSGTQLVPQLAVQWSF